MKHKKPRNQATNSLRNLFYPLAFVIPATVTADKFGFDVINKHVSIGQIRKDFHLWQEYTTPHDVGYTYHASGRAAFASALHAAGVDPTSIKIAARWAKDSDMHLRYIDVDKKRAASLSDQVCAQLR